MNKWKNLVQNLWNRTQWKSMLTQTNPPVDYPKKLLPSNGKLSPKAIDFDIMKNITSQCYREKNWK